ncbi:uncharacterized protein Z520_11004 [Fonsecaea multimorphosa CBS 102226]|uniref:DJ-1/PfpI domain-containing protein n=1 Tax=Fonsecaea multimorphosa CBS 102226 TaxID=1442371 RepID=A0A0D2I846_9EURO|nr:uncharacterized protein Z520_11004 [Fonsecaea multimorphosa CBS 102226]KIX93361.1 hypothetical protein Z520_11004 [Fonsecaea multimorphosa CBS 102226]OAL18597.1 hypothetical protein AYO22_10574 [Fonsecaea multimorphosa]
MSPVAAVLCGKQPQLTDFMLKNLLPKIEVVHVCNNADTAVSEIPTLLKGDIISPSSGLGANAQGSGRSDISFIIIGGGFSPEDVQAIKSAADGVKPVAFFCADTSKTPAGAGPPPGEMIKKRMMDAIEKEEEGDGKWAPGVYMY